MTSRRTFLKTVTATSLLPLLVFGQTDRRPPIRIGLISDVHQDIIHDAGDRLSAFLNAMAAAKADAVLQMGDFCTPKPENRGFVERYRSFAGPTFHVLGNHDTDGGFQRPDVQAFWGMKERYYSFDLGGFHFVVLDSNDRPKDFKGGYPSHLAEDQIAWLEADLARTGLNTFVFSHHSLERPVCIDNQVRVRAVIEAARTGTGARKVAACFNGHWHIDHSRVIAGIPYHHINSASYYWLGEKFRRERLPPGMARRFPTVALTAPYTAPLFTLLEIDGAGGRYSLRGATSGWMGPSPAELGFASTAIDVATIRPEITAVAGSLGKG